MNIFYFLKIPINIVKSQNDSNVKLGLNGEIQYGNSTLATQIVDYWIANRSMKFIL